MIDSRGAGSVGPTRSAEAVPVVLFVLLVAAACTRTPAIEPAPSGPGPSDPGQAIRHWPLPPEVLEAQLRSGRIEILASRYAGAGLTGASRLTLRLHDLGGVDIDVKWKRVPPAMDGVNNSPRKELAAYALQRHFLDPEDYVVPTSVARCLPVDAFPAGARPSPGPLRGLDCELGVFSVWLENVNVPDRLFDAERFASDPRYARHMGNFNLVTYLVLHQDGRSGNFLTSTNEGDRRVFAVDNGVAFSGVFYNWFVRNWKSIRVPALPRDAVERLDRIKRTQIDALATVVEMRRTPEGGLEPRSPGPALSLDEGVRVSGPVFQMGLTGDEIDDVWERIEALREEIEEGDVGVLPPP